MVPRIFRSLLRKRLARGRQDSSGRMALLLYPTLSHYACLSYLTCQLPGAFKNASDDVKQGVLQQEEDLNQISGVLGDLHGMASTMGREIDRQTDQLDRITVRVDYANDRVNNTNRRINNML